MAYNTWKGDAAVGDVVNQDDIDTLIDWENDYISLKTDGTARLTVSGSNIGFGTTSPSALTHLYKAATTSPQTVEMMRLQVADEGVDMNIGSGPGIDFYVGETGGSNYGGTVAVVREEASDADSDAAMVFHTATDDQTPETDREKMRITSTGKVGIGTTSPTSLLTVAGSISGSSTIENVGAVTFGSTLNVTGAVSGAAGTFTTLGGTSLALQSGGITAAGNIAGAGALSGSGTLEMVGPTRLGSTLNVSGAVTMAGNLVGTAISGSGTLQMVGGTTIGQSLHVSGALGNIASIGLGTTAVHATAVRQLSIADGTQPQFATANQISIGSKQSTGLTSDGSTLTLQTECLAQNTALDAVGTLSHRITIWLNGIEYYLYLDPV